MYEGSEEIQLRYEKDLDIAAYHAHPAIGRSGLMEINRTPRHYWWKYLSGKAEAEDTDALRIGQAFHTLVLEPSLFDHRFIVWSGADRRTVKGKEEYAAALESGKTAIKASEFSELQEMAKGLLSEPASKKILVADGQIEPSYFWQADGVDCKTRPDYYRTDGIVVDAKTTQDASAESFSKAIINYGYDIQAFMTMEGIYKVTGTRPQAFVFCCVEKDPPYCAAFYSATDEMLTVGEARFNKLLAIYRECKAQDLWPGYGSQIRPIGVPDWFMNRIIHPGENKEAA